MREFSNFSLQEKAGIVFTNGDFISAIKYYDFNVCLYISSKTYIEVFYNSQTNEIEDIAILAPEESRLQLYSANVDLKDLYN